MTRRERLEARLAKREEWAAKAAARSDARFGAATALADQIPLGQPILVGHHSERHARRDAERIRNNMTKGVEEAKLADHHTSCAVGIEWALERSVFSDDADAVEKLEARIAENEAARDKMKLVNKLWKKGDAAGLAAIGVDFEKLAARLAEAGPYWGDKPHLPYEMTNLGASIRRDRERIEEIKVRQTRTAAAEAAPTGVTIEGTDYVRVTFAEKPDRAVLDALRAAQFRWSGGSWMGYRSKLPEAVAAMITASNSLDKGTGE
jgi:hypothetical protein